MHWQNGSQALKQINGVLNTHLFNRRRRRSSTANTIFVDTIMVEHMDFSSTSVKKQQHTRTTNETTSESNKFSVGFP